MEDKASISEARVPYLSSMPILGKLFRSKRQAEGSSNRKVETLFFVTVSLIDREGQLTRVGRRTATSPALSNEAVGAQSVIKTSNPPLTPVKG